MEIKLGDLVKDKITGFEGVAIGFAQWLWNCDIACVKPTVLKDHSPIESCWFDVPRLRVVTAGYIDVVGQQSKDGKPGGPTLEPYPKER